MRQMDSNKVFMQIFQKNYRMSKHIFRLKDKKMIFCLIKNIKIDKVNLETKNNEDLINQFPCAYEFLKIAKHD